jgi:CHRD domain
MKIKRKAGQLTFATMIIVALSYAAITANPGFPNWTIQSAFAQEIFVASNMTGAKEVPPVNTMASGSATFVNNQTVIDYDLSVSDLYNVTAAHIHQGRAGVNGPIVVTLYITADPSPGLFGGYSGNITSSMLEGPLKGKQLSALVDILSNGQAYVNVHTIKNKNGEIRDQVAVSSGNTTGLL